MHRKIPNFFCLTAFARRSRINVSVKKHLQSVFQIYCCAAFFVYSTAFLIFYWDLSLLLWRFSASDILGFLSYQLTFALLESTIVTFAVAVIIYLIPLQQVKKNRSAVGALFVLSFAISGIIYKQNEQIRNWLGTVSAITGAHGSQIVVFLWLFTAGALPLISILMVKTEKVVAGINWVIENLSILAGLYTIMSCIGMLFVISRNLP